MKIRLSVTLSIGRDKPGDKPLDADEDHAYIETAPPHYPIGFRLSDIEVKEEK